tara:strand:+ start:494 stop:1126 length:633 start_codon:yes stop_codon:yes gene_type:complete
VNGQELKINFKDGKHLPVMESFYTIQGEGFHSGSPAHFIRTAGCDVGCGWCDVKESWDEDLHPIVDIKTLINDVKSDCNIVVVTGGEPLLWNMKPLTKLLKKNNFKTHIETSGSSKLTGEWDWICLSPKKRKSPNSKVYEKAHELKIVIYNNSDFKFAEEQAKKVNSQCMLFLQPEWTRKDLIMPKIVDYVMKNSKWKISLQTHKYLNIP